MRQAAGPNLDQDQTIAQQTCDTPSRRQPVARLHAFEAKDQAKDNQGIAGDRTIYLPLVIWTAYDGGIVRRGYMRLLIGIILGALLTIIAVYIVDLGADGVEQRRMVNWDVVGERLSGLTTGVRTIWADFTREITGPP
jgi:hypothetical protein